MKVFQVFQTLFDNGNGGPKWPESFLFYKKDDAVQLFRHFRKESLKLHIEQNDKHCVIEDEYNSKFAMGDDEYLYTVEIKELEIKGEPEETVQEPNWLFIEKWLPDYGTNDDVMEIDILSRWLDGEDSLTPDDQSRIYMEYDNDDEKIQLEIDRLERKLYMAAMEAYLDDKYSKEHGVWAR